MALVSKAYVILMELALYAAAGGDLIPLFSFNIGLAFLILCLIIS